MTAKSKAELMRETRKRRKDGDLVKAEVYIPASKKPDLAKFIAKLGGTYNPK